MIDQELLERVTRLPVPERLELLEVLTHSLRDALGAATTTSTESGDAPAAHGADTMLAAITQHAHSIGLAVPPESSLHQLRGMAAGGVPMTKAAVRDLVTDVVRDKYR